MDQLHLLPVVSEHPRFNPRNSAGIQSFLRRVLIQSIAWRLKHNTCSFVRVPPVRVAVVSTLVPSAVISSKGTPSSNSMELDLNVDEVSIPTVFPPRFLMVAFG